MAVTGGANRALALAVAARWPPSAGVARTRQNHVELTLDYRLQKVANPIAQADFDRIKPVVEKIGSRMVVGWKIECAYCLPWRGLQSGPSTPDIRG